MKFQAATVIAGAAMAAGANAQQATQWRVQDGGNGHWYAVSIAGFPRTWNDCRVTALHEGGHLATLTSAGEHAFVLARAQATAGAWSGGFGPVLGGYQPVPNGGPAADWTWLTGEPWAFETWINGEPNDHAECGPGGDERFLAFLADGWNDIQDVEKCSFGWLVPSFVIEWSADCNGDGVVDYGQVRSGMFADADGDNVPDCCERGEPCVPEPATCGDADLFPDTQVNGADLGIMLSQWGASTRYTVSDLNHDSVVDGLDLGILLSFWGPCSP